MAMREAPGLLLTYMFQFGSLLVKGEGSFEFKKGSLILLKEQLAVTNLSIFFLILLYS